MDEFHEQNDIQSEKSESEEFEEDDQMNEQTPVNDVNQEFIQKKPYY